MEFRYTFSAITFKIGVDGSRSQPGQTPSTPPPSRRQLPLHLEPCLPLELLPFPRRQEGAIVKLNCA